MSVEQKINEELSKDKYLVEEAEEQGKEKNLFHFLREVSANSSNTDFARYKSDFKKVAELRLTELLERNKVLFIVENGKLTSDKSIENVFDIPPIRYFMASSEYTNETETIPLRLITVIQQTRAPFHKTEKGYLKIDLKNFTDSVSRRSAQNTLVAFYVANEDKFYFKPGKSIFNYAQSIVDRISVQKIKNENKGEQVSPSLKHSIVPRSVYMKIKPEANENYSPPSKDRKDRAFLASNLQDFNEESKPFFMNIPGGLIPTKLPTTADEEDIITYFNMINHYDTDFRLRFKTASRLLEQL